MKSKLIKKAKEEMYQKYADFPSSAHWFKSVELFVETTIEKALKDFAKKITKDEHVLASSRRVHNFMEDFWFSQDDGCIDIETVVDALETYDTKCREEINQNIKNFLDN